MSLEIGTSLKTSIPASPFPGLVAEDRLRELPHMTASQLRQVLALPTVQKAVREHANYHLHKLLERYRVEHYQGNSSNFWRVKQAPRWITVVKLPTQAACLAYLSDHGCDENGNLLKDPDPAASSAPPPSLPSLPSVKSPSKRAPEWHAEAVHLVRENFASITTALLDATRRAVWLGLLLQHIKARGKQDHSIPHGQFRKWVTKNLSDLSDTTVTFYMTIGKGVMEQAKLTEAKCRSSAFCHDGKLPAEVEPLISGKTQQQLFLEYKQAKIQDDCYIPARGNLSGKGNPKASREIAQQLNEKARLEALDLHATQTADWLLEVSDDKHLGLISDMTREQLLKALDTAAGYLRRLAKKGTQQ